MNREDAPKEARVMMQRMEDDKVKGFDSFMNLPTTKLLISMVPECPNPDLLHTLLRATFMAGADVGAGAIAYTMLTSLFDKEKRPPQG